MFNLPPYASPIERLWRLTLIILCALVLLFLITPILAIMPLSFNEEPYFTYPMPGLSMKWYEDFFTGCALDRRIEVELLHRHLRHHSVDGLRDTGCAGSVALPISPIVPW